MALLQGKAEEDPTWGVSLECQGLDEEIILHLGGQMGVPPSAILGYWGSKDPKVMENPSQPSFNKSFFNYQV